MADRKTHRRMTSAEQVRRSQSNHGAAHASHATPAPAPRATSRTSARHVASRSEGAQSYSARLKKKRRGRVLKVVLAVLLVAFVGVGAAAAAYIVKINSAFQQDVTDDIRAQLTEPVEMQDPFYMLLLGVDKSEGRAEDWGDSTVNFRSDTIILTRVDAPAQKVTLVSIPRDTLVDMGANGERKINDAYSIGGGAYMMEVVEEFAGVDITAYAEVDFEQFTSIVDAIGGVEVTLPVAVSDVLAAVDLPEGTQTINGAQALGLCRARHAYDEYGGGDFYRAANQRMVIGAIIKKVLTLDPVSMLNAVASMAESVAVYPLTANDIMGLAMQFKSFDVDTGFYSGQTPTISTYTNNVWYELPDEDGWREMMERVDSGLPPYSDESQDFTHGVAGSIGVSSGDGTSTGDDDSSSSDGGATFSGNVLVLNGTTVSGLAASKSTTLEGAGFSPYADSDSSTDHTTSAVYYNGDARSAALGVAQTLGIDEANVSENTAGYSTEYDVVVVLGTDQAE
ncbi:LCP family protein [Olsenella sp. An270]|uniref:LCP family protein n=1 Tax=Olsenella sp. An270 TaxID=1965615 RepID=UPI001180FE10|nr:LCP family protein [Olsenella sp. An270]